jgi:2-oxoglutarate ferredoxin oxidoreductase subunit alpha
MFDLTVRAFNLAETYRVPVFVLADGFMGHMRERVVIPEDDVIIKVTRKVAEPGNGPLERRDFQDPEVAPMPVFGRGCKAHVTSSCHDAHGMRNLTDPKIMHDYTLKPIEKILSHWDDIIDVETDYTEGDVVLVAYGTVARSAKAAVRAARAKGIRSGTFRPKTLWPFPEKEVAAMASQAKRVIVLENNTGQLFPYVKAEAAGFCPTDFLGPKLLGQIHDPDEVVGFIEEVIR